MKNILFPTDFSACANNALKYACELAFENNANLFIQTVFWVPVYENDTTKEIRFKEERYRKQADKELEDVQNLIKTEYPELTVRTIVNNGFLKESIFQAIKEHYIDLVVMGTKGASGLGEILMGSNTADVIERAPCPVLAIPEKAKFNTFSKIMLAVDYHDSDMRDIRAVTKFARTFESELFIVHNADEEHSVEAEKTVFNSFVKHVKTDIRYKNLHFKLLEHSNKQQGIQEFIQKEQVELLVLSMRKRSFFSRLFDRSLTQKMALHNETPLLVLHAQDIKHEENIFKLKT